MIRALLLSVLIAFSAVSPERAAFAGQYPYSQEEFLEVAVPLVARWEGKRNRAYQDVIGVWTICFGTTRGVRPGDYKTDAECEALLRSEIIEYRHGLHRYFTDTTKSHRLTPERDAAYTSLAINVGWVTAGKSTATRRLNAGDIRGGCIALTWYNKAGGKIWRGLVRRRSNECELCLIGVA